MIPRPKYVRVNGIVDYLSPLILSGELVACGANSLQAIVWANAIVDKVPTDGINREDLFVLICGILPPPIRYRYITIEVVRSFLLSDKSHSPLFIFLGGMAGKTLLGTYISQQLGVTQAITIDNEKYRLVDIEKDNQEFLWQATYESPEGYIKTVEVLVPWMLKMVDRNLFDYKRYKKWCYLWEGIYLSPQAIRKLYEKHKDTSYFLSVFVLPKFTDVKRRYLLRWQKELGVVNLKKRKNIIDNYLRNIKVMRGRIEQDIDPIASFVISSPFLEERLRIFYALLHQTFADIARRELTGWVAEIDNNPQSIKKYKEYLTNH